MALPTRFQRYPTDYNPLWPTTSRVAAKLLVHSRIMGLDEISSALDLTPTSAHPAAPHLPAGDRRREFRRTTNTWAFTSEDDVSSMDIRDHLDWLLERIGPRQDSLAAVRAGGKAQASIVVSYALLGTGGPSLWPKQMRRIADLDMELSFHLTYDPGER